MSSTPVSMQQLIDAGTDCGTIASIATSTAETVVDRLGQTKQTMTGACNKIGFEQAYPYNTAGQTLLRPTQTVSNSGAIYAPAIGTVFPFTTSGAFNTLLWRIVSSTETSLILSSYQVANIAALRAKTPTIDPQQINLTSHTNDVSGGGGVFVWDSGSTRPDDNGCVIKVGSISTGRWIRQLDDSTVTPAMFGAVGGVVDETETIQATLTFAASNQGVAVLFTKKYKASSSLVFMGGYAQITANKGCGIDFSAKTYIGLLICTLSDMSASECMVDGLTLSGGSAALKVTAIGAGSTALGAYTNISVKNCNVSNTGSGAIWVYHGINVDISNNVITKGGDNSVYAEFSKNVNIHDNFSINAQGSGSFVGGYSDNIVSAENINIYNNISYNTGDVAGAANSGAVLIHCKNSSVYNNTIDCKVPGGVNGITGILIDENTVSNVNVYGNKIYNAGQAGIVSGTNQFYGYNISIYENKIEDCSKAILVRYGNNTLVKRNIIDRCGLSAIVSEATAYNTDIDDNTINDSGLQSAYSSASIVSASAGSKIRRNSFSDSRIMCGVTSTATLPSVSVGVSDSEKALLSMYSSGALVREINIYFGNTWLNLKNLIRQTSGWDLIIPAGQEESKVTSVRRSGPRYNNAVNITPISSFHITTAEPNGYIYLFPSALGSVVVGNTFKSGIFDSNIADQFDGGVLFTTLSDTQTDMTSCGGGRTFRMSTSPTATGKRYAEGDRVIRNPPTVGQPKSWVATSHGIDVAAVWASEGNL